MLFQGNVNTCLLEKHAEGCEARVFIEFGLSSHYVRRKHMSVDARTYLAIYISFVSNLGDLIEARCRD